ncbi:hypothetical protein KIN20_003599 [Parelaphostrongylus tenuis]|uniref:Uncharacterized protein n=1 Tax=Parelaphostrongylus tenuis TaxID=148309 RepID=A0AAD5MFU9_PARTN|nr:hypothetical protein KIN20_003599 [Parelaphostrongylus tenuis]
MAEAAETEKSISQKSSKRRQFKTKMIRLRRPDGTVAIFRKAMTKVIYDYQNNPCLANEEKDVKFELRQQIQRQGTPCHTIEDKIGTHHLIDRLDKTD